MVIGGEWILFEDDALRPIIRGEILSADNTWVEAYFLVDTGADRTVFNAAVLPDLSFSSLEKGVNLGGVGGLTDSVTISTKIRFYRENNIPVTFRGEYVAVTELESLDFCVLGRDIIGLFAAIFDQPNRFIGLVGGNHIYKIEAK